MIAADRNLADDPFRAAMLSPPFAAVPGLLLPQLLSGTYDIANSLQYLVLIVLMAYTGMWLVAIPVLCVTRKRVHWTPLRVILLGGSLGGGPWMIALLWTFGSDLVRHGLAQAVVRTTEYEWFPLVWLAACGALVAAAFATIQKLTARRS